MTEDLTPQPEDSYGIAKLAVEQELRAAHADVRPRLHHLPAAQRLRRAPEHRRPLPQRGRHLHEPDPAGRADDGLRRRRRRRAPSATSTTSRRSSRAPIEVPRAYNQVFNIGADVPYTVNELAQRVAEAMGVKPDVAHLPARNEVMHAHSSHTKVAEFFGAAPAYSLPEGLARHGGLGA